MTLLRIEHPVADYDAWKRAFDSDPMDRKGSGVKKFSIFRPSGDSHYVIIDLEFDDSDQANALLSKLKSLWQDVEGKIIFDPKARILQLITSG